MWVKNCIRHRLSLMGGEKTRLGARTFKQLQTAESFPLLLKPPYGTMTSEADENKKADCFSAIGIGQ